MIHQHYYPEMTGTGRRTKELAESFVKKGHKVNVLTSFPRDFRSMPGKSCSKYEIIKGVEVYRVKTVFDVNKNVLIRLFSYLFFIIQSIKLALKISEKVDIIISIAPLPSGILGGIIQLIKKKPHHFDVPDILPDIGISAGMIKNKILISFLYRIEKWVYKNSKSISTCTQGQLKNILDKGISHTKLSHISDWVDTIFFDKYSTLYKKEVENKYNFKGKKLVSFFGNIGALQNPNVFISIMKSFSEEKNDNILFLFFGDGILSSELKNIVKKENINNVMFMGRIDRKYVPACMKMSDVLVSNYVSDKHLSLYIPGKLFEYAISGKPIVMGARGDSKNIIEKYSLGLAVEPSNKSDFKKAIIKIIDRQYEYLPNTNQFINDYSLKNVVKLYDNVFRNFSTSNISRRQNV